MLIALALASACLGPDESGPDLATLRAVVENLQADIKDVEFTYTVTRGSFDDREAGRPPAETNRGQIAWRADNSVHIAADSVFDDPARAPEHESTRHLGGVFAGGRFGFDPTHFQLATHLRDHLRHLVANFQHYECLGWEDMAGRRCLKVRFASNFPPGQKPVRWEDFWVDLGRGGVPLRYEMFRQGNLWVRIEGFELARFPVAPDREVWLPIRGTYQTFLFTSRPAEGPPKPNRPILEATLAVQPGSVRLNQGLSDERFGAFR